MSGCEAAGVASTAVATVAMPSRENGDDMGEDPKRFDFGFAFNNADFADRIVQLRICPDEATTPRRSSSSGSFGAASGGSPSRGGGSPVSPTAAAAAVAAASAAGNLGKRCSSIGGGAGGMEREGGGSDCADLMDLSGEGGEGEAEGEGSGGAGDGEGEGEGRRDVEGQVRSQRQIGGAAMGTGTCGGCGLGGGGSISAHLGGSSGNLGGSGGANLGGGGGGGVTIGSCGGYRVVNLHLSSVVLAAKSAFFRTLFTCGFKETCQNNPVVLNVSPEEEGPVIDLLRFIYTGDMAEGSSDPEDIIKMYLVADKFGVASCMKICLERLVNLPMTVPTACLYLSLPDSMHSHRGVAQLLEASRGFLVAHFRDLERVHKGEEFLELPLVGVQTLLASDELNVRDELTAFHAMVEWLRHHHDDLDDRKRAAVRLAEHVRFPLMTGDDLEDVVLKAPEVDSPECQALVREAAWFRAYSLVRRLRLMNETAATHRRFWQRRWNRNSVGHVYFDIHLERFQALAVAATVESATFGIGGKRFYLSARHGRRDDGTETLDIHLHLENSHSVQPEIQVSFIFYAKRWPEGQFDYLRDRVTKGFGRNASNWGYSNILGRPWADVVQDESKYFKNGVMSVFAEVQILEDAGRGPVVGGSAPLPTAGPTRPGPAARPKVGKVPSEGRDQERLVVALANPIHAGMGDGEEGNGRQSAVRSARGDADVGVAAKGVAQAEQCLQQAVGEETEQQEGRPAQGVPARVAWTRAAAAAAALESPPPPGVAVLADENSAQTPTTGPTAAEPALMPRTAAAAMSKTATSAAGAAGAGTAPLGAEQTDQAGDKLVVRAGAGDEVADDGESSARVVAVEEVPGHGTIGTSAGEGPAREEEAAKHRHLLRPQPHPRRLGAGLGPARPGPLAGWEQQVDSPDAPAPGVGVACPSSNAPAGTAEGTHEAEAVIAAGADHEDTLERRGDTAERRRWAGTSRQRALQDQADERAAGRQPQNAAPRAAGRGRGRGRNGGRGPRDLAGAVAREKARSGNWRERHERPEEQVEDPMNEGEEEGGSEYMASQEADSEDASLEAEQGVPIPTTNRAGGIGRERVEAPADVGESGPQQPNEAASKERDPSIIVDDEATRQRIHAWDLGPLQSSAQPFLTVNLLLNTYQNEQLQDLLLPARLIALESQEAA
ncbi:unnamed protein product [Closterium sp. Naga37s-1]|nr:unnamed protein product [Closterium sp. Naga37s-1]